MLFEKSLVYMRIFRNFAMKLNPNYIFVDTNVLNGFYLK
jgi:hypothetical protein